MAMFAVNQAKTIRPATNDSAGSIAGIKIPNNINLIKVPEILNQKR
jgi:hypothetical protein